MPQIIPYSQQRALSDERMRGGLSNALGFAGDRLATHLAQQNMRQAMSGPAFLNASPEEQAIQLQQATAPYGESGQRLLQPYLQQLQAQRQQAQQGILAKAIRGEKLTPHEEAQLGAKEQIEMMKARNRPPAGGLSGQAVPREVAQAIPQILNENIGANSEQLTSAFDAAGIPRAYTNSYIETRRREDEAKKGQEGFRTKARIDRDEEIIKKVDDSRKTLAVKKASNEVMRDAILNNDMGFFSPDNLATKVPGFEWLTSARGASFKTAQKNHLISSISQITGQKNQWIEKQITDAYAKIGRPQDANMAAMAVTEFESDAMEAWNNIVDQLDSEGNYPPGKLGSEASKRMEKWYEKNVKELNKKIEMIADGKVRPEEFAAPEGTVVMYAPDGGVLYVNPEEVKKYKSLGATQP